MEQPQPRTRLEQLVHAAQLSVPEFVERYTEAAQENKEKSAHVSISQARRWLAGQAALPHSVARRVLERWWGEPLEKLFGPPVIAPVVALQMPREDLIVNAGRESVEHAIEAASALDPSALEQLHAAAQRAAREYYVAPPMRMLTDLVRLRDTVYAQLDRTHKPRQQAELYLLAGQICGLLSSVSWDLGHPDVADEQARAAHTYGRVIDHPSLCAWARALQVTVTFWSGRPRQAANLAAAGLETAPPGTARVRLHSVHARALGLVGARQEVDAALHAAADELANAGDDPFLDEIGGELHFDAARRGLCAGASYVTLGDGERAESEATKALEIFAGLPEPVRWGAGELGAQVDLSTARTLRDDLAGAEAALGAVFALNPERRTEAIARRLTNLGRLLGTTRYRGSIESTRIGEQIEDFTARSLPNLTSRPAIISGTSKHSDY